MSSSICTDRIDHIADPNTDNQLLPGFMVSETNAKNIELLKISLRMAMCNFLNDEQRKILHMKYWLCMSQTKIADELGVTPSSVSQRLKFARELLRVHIEFVVRVYSELERIYAHPTYPEKK